MTTEPSRVIAAVITRDSRFLVCQRPDHKRHGGLWEFPGGKLEPAESDFEAAARELREELGVTVVHVGHELLAIHDPGSPFVIAFVEVAIEGEPQLHEHSALGWFTVDELRSLPMAPSDRRFAEEHLTRDAARS